MSEQVVVLSDKQKKLFENMRACWYDIVSYLPVEDVFELCQSLNPLACGICCHDKDLNANGELKKVHSHIVICFHTRKRATRLVKMFNTTELRAIEYDYQLKGSFEYLTHENQEDKVKYEKSKLLLINGSYFDNFEYVNNSKDNSLDIITKLLNGYSLRKLVSEYGKDFVYHYRNYYELALAIKTEERSKLILEEVNTDDIESVHNALKDNYIQGDLFENDKKEDCT